ncbi:pyridoxamine 5'-phosphate oxidase family protein [Paenibacillus sp. DMB20]|uniref:pyridoxamine 5'-phosphate oxidase family protein n=1 Tax=Paenibacillus sp. DMB20 TaxID=1642570 RepID=UPI0006274F30|nr:pyridoxamine 5'-phosphate oxidase family protein [Paenibacillus sp. DMB20]KKO51819.1 phosphohydrolase [Paenibacillus sp. DMB20]
MNNGPFQSMITNADELTDLYGKPSQLVNDKVIHRLDEHCRDFIAKSPLLYIATSDESGNCDVSPRGDHPGFVRVLDDRHLVIPERPGNRRFDSMQNILSNPKIGIIFVIPGLKETLRINGSAVIMKDEPILDQLQVQGKKPWFGIGVKAEECFIHCAKAFLRSRVWEPDSWPAPSRLPKVSKILADHANQENFTEEAVSQALKESYEKRLY